MRRLGEPGKRDADVVLRKLAAGLGMDVERLMEARAVDEGSKAAPFTADVMNIAVKAQQLGEAERAVLDAVADALLRHMSADGAS